MYVYIQRGFLPFYKCSIYTHWISIFRFGLKGYEKTKSIKIFNGKKISCFAIRTKAGYPNYIMHRYCAEFHALLACGHKQNAGFLYEAWLVKVLIAGDKSW